MKKVMMTLALLLTTVAMSAQLTGVKIAPKYQKGDNMLYRNTATMSLAGQVMNFVTDTRYVVTEATPDGYVIETTLLNMDTDAKDLMASIVQISQQVGLGTKVIYQTDADGKVTAIKNFDEVKKNTEAAVDKMIEEMFARYPEAAEMLGKDGLKEQVMGKVTEETLVARMQEHSSPLSLNGKTIATGTIEDTTNEDGQKVKNMYFLSAPDGSKVKVTTTLNMTKEDMKQMIIDEIKEKMPDQVEIIEQNIDQFMQSGMFNFELNQTTDYEFLPGSWAKTITCESKQKAMGQDIEMSSKVELIEK